MNLTLETVKFQPGEPENVRRPKLALLLDELRAAVAVTTDPSVAALAAVTGAADKLPYFTSATAMALADFGTSGRTLVALTAAQGDVIYGSAAGTFSKLAKDTNATRYLSNTGASNSPAWAQVNLTNGVTGDLPFANLAQGAALSVLGVTGNATADVASIAAASDGQVLRRSGTAVAFGAVNLASTNAVTGVLPVSHSDTGTSGNKLALLDGANTWSATQTFADITATGLDIGGTSADAPLYVERTNSAGNMLLVATSVTSSTGGAGAIMAAYPTPTASGHRLGYMILGSRNAGGTVGNATAIVGYAGGAWTAGTSHPSYMDFEVTPSGSTTRARTIRIEPGGVDLASGKVLSVNGTQVLAAQGAAVADASGGATIDTQARTAINSLLARLRAHGLIAT